MLRLLLIDDNPNDRILTIRQLRREFPLLLVEEVIDSSSFQAALNRGNFDIAITEYCLQWNNGIAVFQEIKSQIPNCPVIMFTASGNEEIAVAAMRAGLDDYITKSTRHYARLPIAVQAVLRQRRDISKLVQLETALQISKEQFSTIPGTLAAICQRKLTEVECEELLLQLKSERSYLHTVLQQMPSGVAIASAPEGKLLFHNAEAIQLLGHPLLPSDNYKGYAQYRAFHADGQSYAPEEYPIARAIISGEVVKQEEMIYRRGDDTWTVFLVNAAPIQAQDGHIVAAVSTFHDISERKILEAETTQLNTRLEHLVSERTEQLKQALELEAMLKRVSDKVRDSLDESHILQTAVRELVLVLGISCCNTAVYDLEQGTSTICYEYAIHSPEAQARTIQIAAFLEVYQQLLQGESCQFCSLTPNPLRGRVVMLACPIFDDQGVLGDLWLIDQPHHAFNELEIRLAQHVASQCAIAIRQARLYQAATAQVAQLEKINRLKDDFLSTVSHELRTPLASIKMATQMLGVAWQQANGAVPQRASQYLQILHKECDREISLVNDLLDLSRLDVGTVDLKLTTIELSAWIPDIVEPFIARTHSQQQNLQIAIPTTLPPITTDLSELRRVLTELLHNACKYTPAGEQILISARAEFERMQLQVSNSGVEISAEEQKRVFDKFYRIRNNDPWKHGGTGLGLALVKKLVEHLGGTIQVAASCGWTTFTVELPVSSIRC